MKSFDADSIDMHLNKSNKKQQFVKAAKNKTSYNLSKFSKGEQNINEAIQQEKLRCLLLIAFILSSSFLFTSNWLFRFKTHAERRNSNVTVKSTKSNNEKFTETEITWSENTDRLI